MSTNAVVQEITPLAPMPSVNTFREPPADAPKMKVLAKRTLRFTTGSGQASVHYQVEAKATVQEVPAFIRDTETYKLAKQDGSIFEVSGRSTLEPLISPPTADEVVAQRGCSTEEAQKIVALETIKFNQGEYPYPPVVTAKPNLESLMATGLTREKATQIMAEVGLVPTPAVAAAPVATEASEMPTPTGSGKKNGKASS